MNNKLTDLPERPICPNLRALYLQNSDDLMEIPTTFFECMPALQVLDLSYTSIKSLPQSISKLVSLREFLLKGCELLMKLPPEIGALRNLEVFDLEGTELICLPKEIGELINLTCLKVSFYGYANLCKNSQTDEIIPKTAFSKLTRLKELSIDVNPDDQWWDEEANAILDGLFWLINLKTLNLYLPTVELLKRFLQLKIYPALSHLKLTVGHHDQRIISRLPEKLEMKFKNFDKCLKYKNGKGKTIEITEALKHSSAFFLDRHWTVTNLSEFQIHEMKQLKFCLLLECNEMQTIINEANEKDNDEYGSKGDKPVLTSLEHLHILYMKNFKSILEGRIVSSSLSHLKTLAIHTCPKLTTIFTLDLIRNFVNLEELIVEDCPKIKRLISLEPPFLGSNLVLRSLKKVSLLDLPELISMFSGLEIAPVLEVMMIYNCPKLNDLSTSEVSSKNLKVIKGEREWWGELKWHNLRGSCCQPDHLVSIFVPLRWDRDLMAQLTEDPAAVTPHGVLETIISENENKKIKCEIGGCKIKVQVMLITSCDYGDKTLLGEKISLQLISAVACDPGNEYRGKIGQPAFFVTKNIYRGIDETRTTLSETFDWDEEIGVPGAFIMKNYNDTELYLETLTIEDVPGCGRIHFVCNSWVCPAILRKPDRVFFTNQTYLPSETPAALRQYREEELRKLRGDGAGMRRRRDLVYDYACYNDLGDPDKDSKYVHPVLGGSIEFPYPRRIRTSPLSTKTDPESESRPWFDIYVPRDEHFIHNGLQWRFLDGAEECIKVLLHRLDSTPQDNITNDFNTFEDVLNKELDLWRFEYGTRCLSSGNPYQKSKAIREKKLSWRTDEEFTRDILAGLDPVTMRRFEEFPPTSNLDPKVYGNQRSSISKRHIENNLDGLTLEKAIENRRLFILDLHDAFMPYLRRMNTTSTRTYATRTILFLQNDGTLKPLAIELSLPHPRGDQFGAISQVCTPAELGVQHSIWQLAKSYATVNYIGYLLISRWLNNNAVIEPFVIATNRQLSVLHPIYKLLHPHFRDIIQINAFARKLLLNADGVLEKTFSVAEFGMEMSAAAYKDWVFPEQALPVNLIKRGMAFEDSNSPHGLRLLIEDNPCVVDGLKIWLAIKAWVEDYCSFYYRSDDTVRKDSELQSWWKELREVGHGDKKDESWWPQMQTRKELMDTCTIIIWMASGLHATISFASYHYATYFAKRPTISRRFMPEPGTPEYAELESNPEKALLETINTPTQIILANFLIKVLFRQFSGEVYLGQSDTPEWTTDTELLQAFERFRKNMADIEQGIKEMNNDKKLKNKV
ncbi:hypothetical protein F0562_029083 [Nyssa sinensis]|uniref:Lipoxygenase n=1 Tax=Nyssa sinensis TaxID=561372 RepID=A0A5J5B024_9ASTE|nr:hypothetical protein F0562_029083 [Nyssa sinensis]